ncbi:acylphosphatase [Patescibacteria group bacterium]|nr:acylphosphatase [Patescibacteria group bacterium]
MRKHFNIKIHGHVQGVFFRVAACEKANELGVTGFVRNEPDGSVYIEAEGEESALSEFLDWCHHGPPSARVGRMEVRKSKDLKRFEGFKTKR